MNDKTPLFSESHKQQVNVFIRIWRWFKYIIFGYKLNESNLETVQFFSITSCPGCEYYCNKFKCFRCGKETKDFFWADGPPILHKVFYCSEQCKKQFMALYTPPLKLKEIKNEKDS